MSTDALAPGSVIGIVGGGQLGRMLAQAAARLGFRASIYAPEADSPAFDVAAFRHCAAYDDEAALARFADEADAVTFEFENIPAEALAIIETRSRLSPPRRALEATQSRLAERRLLADLELPCAPHEPVENGDALAAACARLWDRHPGTRLFLKRARLGYDGKGQMRLTSPADLARARDWLGADDALLESEVPYAFELSMLCVRGRSGEMRFYDPPRNIHGEGILRESIAPAPLPADAAMAARNIAGRIAEVLDYVGVISTEMFAVETPDGLALFVNEIAPRVHNSGHWTPEACFTGQFENHIRAVAGWPLGSTERHCNTRLVNLLGEEALDWRALLEADPRRVLTLYGKREPREGRKMGHYVELTPKS
jgi:5-(carboxyamino)imidazole ribonucleotide synthase